MALGYFDPNSTPDQLKQRRGELDYLASRLGRAQNVGAGIGDMISGLAVGYGRHKAAQAEKTGTQSGRNLFDAFLKSSTTPQAPQSAPSAMPPNGGASMPQTQNGPVARPMGVAIQGFGDGQTGQMVAQRLQKDFGLSPAAAAGFAGNLAHESGNFKTLQEKNPMVAGSRGGFGWAQWTGPRRRQFESWAAQNGLDPSSPEANYGFLKTELQGSEGGVLAKLKGVNDPAQAAQIVSQNYLRPGIPHMDSRIQYANQIAGSMGEPQPQAPPPPPYQQPMEQPQQAAPQAPMQGQQQGQSPQFEAAMRAYSNAWTTPEEKQLALMTIQQEMQKQDPMHQLQMQAAQQGVDKGALEIKNLKNPKPDYQFIDGRDGSIFLGNKSDGSLKSIYGASQEYLKYLTAMKQAGATTINMSGQTEYAKTRNKGFADRANEMDQGELSANKAITALSVMEKQMSDPNFYSGFGANQLQTLKSAMVSMGGDPAQVSSGETFGAQAKQLALDAMGGSLGTGFSNADRDFVTGQVPGLEYTAEGNKQLISIQRDIAKRKIEMARKARDYESTHGQIDNGFFQELSQWAEANPVFKGNESGLVKAGTIEDGYRFKGGDPANPSNWEPVK
jgi:hypothetical protein